MQDLASALTGSLSRDGLGGMRADLQMGGFKATNLAPGTNPTDAATFGQINEAKENGVPIGAEFFWPGTTPPTGYMLEYGQAISRATYATLFSRIGTTYGAGDGTTTFNLPDCRGVAIVGKDDMGGSASSRLSNFTSTVLGAIFGSQSHTLTTPEMPSHRHTVNTAQFGSPGVIPGGGALYTVAQAVSDTTDTGGGGAHNNVQPTTVRNVIIKVL